MAHRCKICDSPPLPDNVRPADVVNRLLTQKVPYKQIQKISGFDKSLISRHSIKCITRAQASEIKSSYFQSGDRMHVLWPGREIPHYLGPRDWIIRVSYGKDSDQPTKMLTHEEAAALQLQMKTPSTPAVETATEENPEVREAQTTNRIEAEPAVEEIENPQQI